MPTKGELANFFKGFLLFKVRPGQSETYTPLNCMMTHKRSGWINVKRDLDSYLKHLSSSAGLSEEHARVQAWYRRYGNIARDVTVLMNSMVLPGGRPGNDAVSCA